MDLPQFTRAVHRQTNQECAVKIIDMVEDDFVDNMLNELDILAKIEHPNILSIREILHDSDHFYIVTEPISGVSLLNKVISDQDARRVI